MSRTIYTSTIAALASDSFNFATLIKFEFDTPIYLTDWYQDVSALSATWASSSHFLGVSNSTESSDLRVNGLSVTLSGVEQSYISIFLSQDYLDVPAKVYRAVFDDSNAIVGAPILVFDGLITGFNIEDNKTESKINVDLASHWKDFEKLNGRKTNYNSQQLHFPQDEGFEFAAKTIKDLKWGRA